MTKLRARNLGPLRTQNGIGTATHTTTHSGLTHTTHLPIRWNSLTRKSTITAQTRTTINHQLASRI